MYIHRKGALSMRIPRLSRQFLLVTLCLALCGSLFVVHASLRGRGRYCGVVIFDRWDTCLLLSGPYIMYISNAVREKLRPYAGQAIEIDASNVVQPGNPGDGLILQYEIVGPAPGRYGPGGEKLDLHSLELQAASAIEEHNTPAFDMVITNTRDDTLTIVTDSFGPTLLGPNSTPNSASDGKSVAWFTRVPFSTDRESKVSWSLGEHTTTAIFRIDPSCHWPNSFDLAPGRSARCRVAFEVPLGEYQFLFGYGGGVHASASLASNAISFNVEQGGATHLAP
jgi:hypothetical protein